MNGVPTTPALRATPPGQSRGGGWRSAARRCASTVLETPLHPRQGGEPSWLHIAATCAWLITVACIAGQAWAQRSPEDAPYVPTPQPIVEAMLALANVTPRDVVYDLGSGDGRVVITAARKFGARAVGVELDSHLVIQSEEAARQAGVERLTRFLEEDLYTVDLVPATVITMYLWPRMYDKLAPALAKLRPGTRIVIYRWGFTEWKPDRRGGSGEETYFLYHVPAQVAGRWRLTAASAAGAPREYEIEFRQRFQEIRAEARHAAGAVPVADAQIVGDTVSFVLVEADGRRRFEGNVRNDAMEGVARSSAGSGLTEQGWRAVRVRAGEKNR